MDLIQEVTWEHPSCVSARSSYRSQLEMGDIQYGRPEKVKTDLGAIRGGEYACFSPIFYNFYLCFHQ